jgi:hypothetical protein
MRRVDFVQAIRRIVGELKAQELVSFLTPIIERSGNVQISPDMQASFSNLLFEAQGGYRDLGRNEETAKILEALNVSRMLSPENFGQLITVYKTAGQTSTIYTAGPSYALFFTLYDFLKWLLTIQAMVAKFLGAVDAEPIPAGTKVLKLEMVDFDGAGVDIARVQELLSALDNLRMRLSILLELPESRLKVRYIESGTDIHFHIEGLGEVIDGLRKFCSEMWTMIMNREFDKIDRRNATIGGNFELIDKIEQRVKAGTISPADGENFKQLILDDAQKLINSGTIPEDAQAIEPLSKEKLLAEARGVKLLGTGESSDPH